MGQKQRARGIRTALKYTPLGQRMVPLGHLPNGRPIYPIAGGDGTEDTVEQRVAGLTHPQALSRMEEVAAEMERLREKDSLSAADEQYRDGLIVEFDLCDQRRARLETEASVARVTTRAAGIRPPAGGGAPAGGLSMERGAPNFDRDSILEPDSIEARRFKNPWDLGEVRQYGRTAGEVTAEYRSRALAAVEKMPMSSDEIRGTATDLIERWDDEDGNLSRLVLATSSPEYLRAWSKMAVDPVHAQLVPAEREALEAARVTQRALSLTDANGGYLVPFQLDPTVILTSDGSYNEIRRIARTVVATGDVWNGVSAGAVQWSFDAEAAEVSDDSPEFGAPSITVRTARGFVPISLEARMDASNIAAEVARLLAQGKDDLEAIKFVTGVAASNEPIGILTALTGVGASTVASTTADTYAHNDLYKVQGALPARYRSRASWLATNAFYNLVRQNVPANATGVFTDPTADNPPRLLGKSTYEAEAMDGTITATEDNLLAVFGDFSNYVIADRVGMTVDFIPHLFGANRRPTGQSGWFAYYRVGADSVNDAAFRVYNVT